MPLRARRKNGVDRWHYRFHIAGQQFTGSTNLEATERNRSAALVMEEEARRMVMSGQAHLLAVRPKKFSEAALEYATWKHGESESAKTQENAAYGARIATIFFGNQLVHQITAGDIERFKTWRRSMNIKPSTLANNGITLSQIFDFSVKHLWCKDNPCENVKWPSCKDSGRTFVLSPEHERMYFAVAAKWADLFDLGRLIINQGCRPNEILSLRPGHINFGRREMTIAKSKTAAGRRILALTVESKNILMRRVVLARDERLFESDLKTCERHHTYALRDINATGAELYFVLHELRHCFASRAAAAGMPLATLAAILGHSSLKIVQRYVHIQSEDIHKAMKKYVEKQAERPEVVN